MTSTTAADRAAARSKVGDAYQSAKAALGEYQKMINDDEDRGHFNDDGRLLDQYYAAMQPMLAAAERNNLEDALKIRAEDRRPTGGKAYGYISANRERSIDPAQAEVVRRIFQRYVEGASCRLIAAELNTDGVASPGSSWKRVHRRAAGWMATCVRHR